MRPCFYSERWQGTSQNTLVPQHHLVCKRFNDAFFLCQLCVCDVVAASSRSIAISIVVVQNPQAGTIRIETAKLRPLSSTLSFVPPRELRVAERVVATLATQPARAAAVSDAVLSILPFVDQVRVFCNGCNRSIPHVLKHSKIEVAFSEDWDNIGDIGKFFWVDRDQSNFDMHFTIDDDILYPPDYVARMVASIHQYGQRALIGVHCVIIKQPTADYYNFRYRSSQFSFARSLSSDSNVHVIGTGTLAYATKLLQLRYDDFSYPNMADIWVALKAQERGLPRICRQRSAGWLQSIVNTASSGIYSHSTSGSGVGNASIALSVKDTKMMQNHILRHHFPIIRPSIAPARLKVVFAITTWNRLEDLHRLVQSFFATKSDMYDWVLIVADDGSTNGTLDYLENVRLHDRSTEMIIIKNNGTFPCGQMNDILELSLKIGFDYGFKVDDDVIEDDIEAEITQVLVRRFGHRVDVEHRPNVEKAQKLMPMIDPPLADASGLLLAAVDGWSVDGRFFTFTSEVAQRAGYCDELNFPIRGQWWHVDLSLRYARAGFNNLTTFYDAKGSNDYIALQVVEDKPALTWGPPAYEKTKDPAETLHRRMQLMKNDGRVYIPRSRQRFPAATRLVKKGTTFDEAFELSLYLNLDTAVGRRQLFERRAERAGIKCQRLSAVTTRSAGFSDIFSAYNQQPLATVEAVRHLKSSWQAYFDYDSQSARTEYFAQRLKRKALKEGGMAFGLSWIRAVRMAMQQNAETLVLFDDDAVFHKNFTHMFELMYAELPDDWMILYLGAIQYSWATEGDMAYIVPYSSHLNTADGSPRQPLQR